MWCCELDLNGFGLGTVRVYAVLHFGVVTFLEGWLHSHAVNVYFNPYMKCDIDHKKYLNSNLMKESDLMNKHGLLRILNTHLVDVLSATDETN